MFHRFFATLALSATLAANASAGIVLDFSDATGTIFDTASARYIPSARAAVDAAAADITSVLNLNLSAMSTTQLSSGTFGFTTADINVTQRYTNPVTGVEVTPNLNIAANEIRVFVGMQPLGGTTLGQGGPGAGTSFGLSGFGTESQWPNAVAAASAAADATLRRGDGPVISRFQGTSDFGAFTGNFDVGVGVSIGNLWFDNDTNNAGGIDSIAELSDEWHFDHTAPVAAGKSDLYSVALHEILHAIGIGTSDSWMELVSGQDWLGSEVISLVGSGEDLIDMPGGHINFGVMSTRISDGMMQEVVMDPNITIGTRKELTTLDLAFLRDIGFSGVTAIPEPGGFFAIAVLAVSSAVVRRRRRRLVSGMAA